MHQWCRRRSKYRGGVLSAFANPVDPDCSLKLGSNRRQKAKRQPLTICVNPSPQRRVSKVSVTAATGLRSTRTQIARRIPACSGRRPGASGGADRSLFRRSGKYLGTSVSVAAPHCRSSGCRCNRWPLRLIATRDRDPRLAGPGRELSRGESCRGHRAHRSARRGGLRAKSFCGDSHTFQTEFLTDRSRMTKRAVRHAFA
jgi:hypothetical protein